MPNFRTLRNVGIRCPTQLPAAAQSHDGIERSDGDQSRKMRLHMRQGIHQQADPPQNQAAGRRDKAHPGLDRQFLSGRKFGSEAIRHGRHPWGGDGSAVIRQAVTGRSFENAASISNLIEIPPPTWFSFGEL